MDEFILLTRIQISEIVEASVTKVLLQQNSQTEANNSLPELLSITQAAAYLNLAKQTLYGFTCNREIPFIKKGKKLYFRKSELEKWVSEGRKKTKDEIGAAITKSLANRIN